MIRIFTRQIERLHSEEGQALVFVALVGLVIFLFFAMTMNAAHLLNTKIKNQNVADAAAMSGAVWEARTLNMIAGANLNMLMMWVAAFVGIQVGAIGVVACDALCGTMPLSPSCAVCLVGLALGVIAVAVALYSPGETGQLQDDLMGLINRPMLEAELEGIAEINYAYKENTAEDDTRLYLALAGDDYTAPSYAQDLLNGTGQLGSTGDFVLERVGLCELFVGLAYFLYHEGVLAESDWQLFLHDFVEPAYQAGGICVAGSIANQQYDMGIHAFPYMLRTRYAPTGQPLDVESLLRMTVAVYKEREAPPVLGECPAPEGGDGLTRFPCPDAGHFALAAARAYSPSVRDFYVNALVKQPEGVPVATEYPVPYVPFVMDWEPRLFPVEPDPASPAGLDAYRSLAVQAAADGVGADILLVQNLLLLGGNRYVLY